MTTPLMRAPSARLFPNVVQVSRATWTYDSARGKTASYGSAVTYKCSVQVKVSSRVEDHGLVAEASGYVIYFPEAIPISVDDRVVWKVDAYDSTKDKTLFATGTPDDNAGRLAWFAITAEERD